MIVNMWVSNLIHYVKGFLLIVFCSLWNSARYHRRKYILQYTIHYFLHTFLHIFCNSYLCMLVYTYVVCLHYCEWVRACWVIIVSVFESICILKSLYSWVCLKLILSIVDLHDLVSFLFFFYCTQLTHFRNVTNVLLLNMTLLQIITGIWDHISIPSELLHSMV